MIRALIVDDERLARGELRRLLAAHPGVQVVGEAANAESARKLIEELSPQLLFLDVQMPGGSGFDLLASLETAPEVIFTTAFDAYAIKAFEVNALDYLQKPIEPRRLAAALERATTSLVKPAAPIEASQRIFIKDGDRCWFVPLSNISLLESEANYTRVYFDSHRPLVLRTLAELEQRLDPRHFFRASRRYIVNLSFIAEISPSSNGRLWLRLSNDLRVEVPRRRALELRDKASL